jgi:hypothetical protein
MAGAGSLTFNPIKDTLKSKSGEEFKFDAPKGEELPTVGFDKGQV